MSIHIRTVRLEPSKKALRKRKMKELRKQIFKYGLVFGIAGIGYQFFHGGFPNQIDAVKKMTSDAVALVSAPVTEGKRSVNAYEKKVEESKAAYDKVND